MRRTTGQGWAGRHHAPGTVPFDGPAIREAFLTTVAQFEIKHHQFRDAAGSLREPAPALARDSAELIKMYRLMTLVRTFDAKAVNLQRTGKLGTYASCLGHEATHVAVGAAMRPED